MIYSDLDTLIEAEPDTNIASANCSPDENSATEKDQDIYDIPDLIDLERGGRSTVFCYTQEGNSYVLKIPIIDNPENRQDNITSLLWEISIHKRLNHHHIIPLLEDGSVNYGGVNVPYAKLPRMAINTSRLDRFARDLSWDQKFSIVVEAAEAVLYMHSQGILHRDIKPANILLDKDYKANICDFSSSCSIYDGRTRSEQECDQVFEGSILYSAPELLSLRYKSGNGANHTTLDQCAFGLTAYEILFGQHPFSDAINSVLKIHQQFKSAHSEIESVKEKKETTPQPDQKIDERAKNNSTDTFLIITYPDWYGNVQNDLKRGYRRLSQVLQQMFDRNPANRYKSMHEAIAALKDAGRHI